MRDIASTEKTNLVAKLMATENISVSFDGETTTAYFDLENRALVMPILENVSNDVIEMFVAHEVSHALNTPHKGWMDTISSYPSELQKMVQTTMNVLEDARIEKLIKNRYPGVVRSMKAGYDELHARNFFGLGENENINERGFIDRMNLYFKSYGNLNVRFSDEEMSFVSRVAAARTFDDVVSLTKELIEKYQNEKENNSNNEESNEEDTEENNSNDEEETSNSENGNDDSSEASESNNDNNGDGETSESESTEDSGENSESESGSESTEDSESGDNDSDSGETSESDSTEDSDSDSDSSEGESTEESEMNDSSNNKTSEGISWDDFDNTKSSLDNMSENLENAANNSSNFEKTGVLRNDYFDEHWREHIVSSEELANYFREYAKTNFNSLLSERDYDNELASVTRRLYKENVKTINNLVKEFEMKKAASMERRAMTSKTGDLDADKLHSYRTNEDIFLSSTTLPEGKNHGIVMYLDLSYSMNSNNRLNKSINQIFNMIMFAEKVGIPYRVYGFSNGNIEDNLLFKRLSDAEWTQYRESPMTFRSVNTFSMIELASSRNSRAIKKVMNGILAIMTNTQKSDINHNVHSIVRTVFYNYLMSQTPMSSAMYFAPKIIRDFQKKENIEKPIFFLYTDGLPNDRTEYTKDIRGRHMYNYQTGNIIDPETKAIYSIRARDMNTTMDIITVDILLTKLRSMGVTTMMFAIVNKRFDIHNMFNGMFRERREEDRDACMKMIQSKGKNKSSLNSISVNCLDDFLVINDTDNNVNDDGLESYMGNSKDEKKNLENAFRKMHKTHKNSRILVRKVIDQIA